MNSQLYAHLEAFDDDDENIDANLDGEDDENDHDHNDHNDKASSVGSHRHAQEDGDDRNTTTGDEDETCTTIHSYSSNRKDTHKDKKEDERTAVLTEKLLALMILPIGVTVLLSLLHDEAYLSIVTLTLCLVCLVFWQQQQSTGIVFVQGKQHQKQQQQQQQELETHPISQLPKPAKDKSRTNVTTTQDQEYSQSLSLSLSSSSSFSLPKTSNVDHETSMQHVYECRKEVSRLLGLIGAPPMGKLEETRICEQQQHQHRQQERNFRIDDDNDNDDNLVGSNNLKDGTNIAGGADADDLLAFSVNVNPDRFCVVRFLEAHVQLVLTIDKALYWVKISSGLHWGLGPYSQCVERVERAAMSKKRMDNNDCKSSSNNSNNNNSSLLHDETHTSAASESTASTATTIKTTAAAATTTRTTLSSARGKQARKGQPQRKADTSSILALSSTRRNIARVIVQEAQSIVDAVTTVEEYLYLVRQQTQQHRRRRQREVENDRESKNNTNGNGSAIDDFGTKINRAEHEQDHDHDYDGIAKNGILVMPEVIDLAWIKSSRKHIASLLTYSVEHFCTRDSLGASSSVRNDEKETISSMQMQQPHLSNLLNESTWTARNLREYLVSNLLLDDDYCSPASSSTSTLVSTSVRPITPSRENHNDCDLILPLLQYRQQLDALDAALWSFQLHTRRHSQHPVSAAPNASANATGTGSEQYDFTVNGDDPDVDVDVDVDDSITVASKLTWWKQVKELSATCQTLEQHIENRFFPPSTKHETDQSTSEDGGSFDPNHISTINSNHASEPRSYEHDQQTNASSAAAVLTTRTTTKTLVFSGKGAKEKRFANKTKQKSGVVGDTRVSHEGDSFATMPHMPAARDVFSEQLLVRELQNRIQAVAALREEEPQEEPQEELPSLGVCRRPLEENEYDQSVEQAPTNEENTTANAVNVVGGQETNHLPGNATRTTGPKIADRKREAASNIFLGASGSLLDELKLNIGPAHNLNGNHDDDDSADEDLIIGTETTCTLFSE